MRIDAAELGCFKKRMVNEGQPSPSPSRLTAPLEGLPSSQPEIRGQPIPTNVWTPPILIQQQTMRFAVTVQAARHSQGPVCGL